jgi:spore coat polysaccharide biosynthesis protein SpsF
MENNMRSVAIVQARLGSSRLPGKVLLDIAGQPMLSRVVSRLRRSALLDGQVVATTVDASDDPLVEFCRENGYDYLRGSQFDVLDRFYQAAKAMKAETVVRITADCPLIDPGLVDQTLHEFMRTGVDFAANRLPPPFRRTYPIGLDIEICTFQALERAWREADQPYQREHVMPYFYEDANLEKLSPTLSQGTTGRGFRVLLLDHVPDLGSLRWTVDTPADLEFMRQVYAQFGGVDEFSWLEVLSLVQQHPEICGINSAERHKSLHEIDERGAQS